MGSYASNVQLTLGLFHIPVDLWPTTVSTKSFKTICPACTDAVQLKQRYICQVHPFGDGAHTDGVDADLPGFSTSTADRAREVSKNVLVRATEDEIKEMKEPLLPTGEMVLYVSATDQLDAATIPQGTSYRLLPRGNPQSYAVLRDALQANPELALYGELVLRSKQKFFRLTTWNGQLLLVELARPDDVNPPDDVNASYDGKLLVMAENLLHSLKEDFDATHFRNTVKERIATFESAKTGTDQTKLPKPAKKQSTEDEMLLALEASLLAAKVAKS